MGSVKHNDDALFKDWLRQHLDVGDRSLSDILSRAKRVRAMADLSGARTLNQVEAILVVSAAFKSQTPSVQSQLKRAAKLYVEFRQAKHA